MYIFAQYIINLHIVPQLPVTVIEVVWDVARTEESDKERPTGLTQYLVKGDRRSMTEVTSSFPVVCLEKTPRHSLLT